jgi:hypothetical protein
MDDLPKDVQRRMRETFDLIRWEQEMDDKDG